MNQKLFTHIYLYKIDTLQEQFPFHEAFEYLQDEERLEVDRIQVKSRLHEFVYSRYMTRHILADYIDTKASDILFTRSGWGRPKIHWPESNIDFNISHTNNAIAICISNNINIGVDIEKPNRSTLEDLENIAASHFSATEAELLLNTNTVEKASLFYRMWTAKEATLKAQGIGLYGSLPGIETSPLVLGQSDTVTITDEKIEMIVQYWENVLGDYHLAAACRDSLGDVEIKAPFDVL